LPWRAPSFAAVKGIIHAPGAKPTMKPESRMLSSPPSQGPFPPRDCIAVKSAGGDSGSGQISGKRFKFARE
ncbi:MAG: hypothetical protein WA231_17095, partial [Methylocella sp.]